MKLITTTALGLVAAVSAFPAAAQYNSAPPPQPPQVPANQPPVQAQSSVKPSSKAFKAIVDLQDSVKKSDFASVPAKVAAAQAVATTKEDRYLIARLQLDAAMTAKDNAGMAAAIDAVAASGYLDATKSGGLYAGLGGTFLNDKHYPEAAAAYRKALALTPNDSEAQRLLGVALFSAGQKADAATAFQRMIQTSLAAGQKPSEDTYRLAVQSAFDAKSPQANDIARQWLAAYPSADSWRNSIAVYRALNQPDVEGTLDLLRLMQATGAMNQASDYGLFARAAVEQNNYNEAQAVLDAGIAAKVVDPANPEFSSLVNGLKAKPKATTADLAEATRTAANGMALLHIGDRYYAMANYAKAVELYRMAMGKPGVDAGVANLHIGMALARAGDKAGATAALNAVTGPRADIAKFWLTYVNQKA